jgi:predicted 3-demethylubiquinone-9 3-methyltransferase (glyoxalase superfamily)
MGVKGGELADGKYVVKIGGTNVDDIIVIPFEVGSQSTVVRGDANGDTVVDVNDATSILLYTVDQYELDGDKLTAADANLDNIVDVNDGTTILLYTVDQYELTSN